MRTVSGEVKDLEDHRRKDRAQVSAVALREIETSVIGANALGHVVASSIQVGLSDRRCAIIHDGRSLFREGLSRILVELGFTTVSAAETPGQEVRRALGGEAQIVFCCIPDGPDFDHAISRMRCLRNDLADLRLVVLADTISSKLLSSAYEADVDAVLSTKVSIDVLKGTIELVMLGQRVYPTRPAMTPSRDVRVQRDGAFPEQFTPPGHVAPLSEREDQILRFLASGTRNKLIAHDLGISEATVKFHIRALLRKLGAANRTQAAILGVSRSTAHKLLSPVSIPPLEDDVAALPDCASAAN